MNKNYNKKKTILKKSCVFILLKEISINKTCSWLGVSAGALIFRSAYTLEYLDLAEKSPVQKVFLNSSQNLAGIPLIYLILVKITLK